MASDSTTRGNLGYASDASHCLRVPTNVAPPQLLAMAHTILLQDLPEPSAEDFGGALIWLRDWNIWSETFERAGRRLVEIVRAGLVDTEVGTMEMTPAYLFGPQELVDAQLLSTLPLLFQWDAYVISASGRCYASISHHGHLTMLAANAAILARIYERFESVNWHPTNCDSD